MVRGSVRLPAIAAAALLPTPPAGAELAPADVADRRALRATLDLRRTPRGLGRRFRQDPERSRRGVEERLGRTLPA